MFTEMLRCAALAEGDASSGGGNNSGHIEVYLCLLQQCVARSMKMTKGSLHKRVELVQIFVELFLSPSIAEDYNDNDINRGNVDAVRNMLKPFLAEARIAKNPRIVCMNIMLHVHYVSVEARALISSIGDIENVKLPTWKEISLCPMYFLQVVRVLYCIASSTNDVIHWADRVDHCIQLLKELDSVFRLCTIDSLIDIVELRAAYYLAINNHAKAEKSLKQFRNYIMQSEKSNLLCSENTLAMNRAVYYRMLARYFYISKRTEIDSLADTDGFIQAVSLWLQNESQLSAKKLNMLVLLYRTRYLSKEALFAMVCDAIERSPAPSPYAMFICNGHMELQCTQWMLWMILASLLGPILPDTRLDLTSPIHSSSDLGCLFPFPHEHKEAALPYQKDGEMEPISNILCRGRKWWYGTIFSISNMGDFVDCVLSAEVEILIEELQHIDQMDCLKNFDVLGDSNVCCDIWDSDHSSFKSDSGSCSLFAYENEFESIFGPGWRLDVKIDYAVDDDDDDGDGEPSDRDEDDSEYDGSDSDQSGPVASDYNDRIPADEAIDGDGGILDDTWKSDAGAISNLCNLATVELFRNSPRTDPADHYCCLGSRFELKVNPFESSGKFFSDAAAGLFTTNVEIGDFLPTKEWQQQHHLHLHETGQEESGLVAENLTFYRLSDRLLEMLAVKTVVCCHMKSQDCLFVTRAVQVLIQHCLSFYQDTTWTRTPSHTTAKKCLLYVQSMGVNILRAAELAKHLALKEVPVCYQSTPVKVFSSENIKPSNIFGQYRPI